MQTIGLILRRLGAAVAANPERAVSWVRTQTLGDQGRPLFEVLARIQQVGCRPIRR